MDRGAWWATVHGVTKSETQLHALSPRAFLTLALAHSVISITFFVTPLQVRSQDCRKAQCGVPDRSVKTALRPALEGELTRATMYPHVGEDGKGARGGDRSWVRPCPPGLGGGRDNNGTVEGDSFPGFPMGVHGPSGIFSPCHVLWTVSTQRC